MSPAKVITDLQQCAIYSRVYQAFFFVVKGPAADATDAPQPWGFLCNPVMKMTMMIIIFHPFPSNGVPVEWNWLVKTCPSATLSTTNPTWTEPGSNPSLRGGRPAANRLIHGTALTKHLTKQ
jgi:hypothetical protein